jgi:CubicO group peptidase (beta-lactamase class C family)
LNPFRPGGFVESGFEPVRDAFAACHPAAVGGAQLCVYRGGRPVVDIWIGRDPVHDRPYDDGTLNVLMSATKGAVAILMQMLHERGELDLEAPIAAYWPGFAAHGKERITLAHVLSHASGLSGYEADQPADPRLAVAGGPGAALLAGMAPLWPPGEAYAYHSVTYGVLLGEVVQRATGRSVGEQFAKLIGLPLGLDFWIGLPEDEQHRVAPHLEPVNRLTPEDWRRNLEAMGAPLDDRFVQTVIHTAETATAVIAFLRTPEGRATEIPAANGISNARSLARLYAAAIGPVDGIQLLKPESIERLRAPRTDDLGPPPPLRRTGGDRQRFGLGVELPRQAIPLLGPGSFGHPGAGGRLGCADPASGMALGYACNGMLWNGRDADPRWAWFGPLADCLATAADISAS